MKKSLLGLFLMMGAVCANAQVVKVYKGGSMVSMCYDADSVVFSEKPDGLLTGAFSVSADKQVYFSSGNLQYTQSTKTWAFAEQQYGRVSTANVSNDTLPDVLDLFGWSGDNTTAPFGVCFSNETSDFLGDFVDWGINMSTNTITWRTLTLDEWDYLVGRRANADSLISVACISINADGSEFTNGLILLPDDWKCPEGIAFKLGFYLAEASSEQTFATYQTIVLSDWEKLEAAGAVFLPTSGYRSKGNCYDVNRFGFYRSSTPDEIEHTSRVLRFTSYSAGSFGWGSLYFCQAVRLVTDVK